MGKENFEKLFTHFSYWVYPILRDTQPGQIPIPRLTPYK